MFDIIDQAMGNHSKDDSLSQEDFQSFYENMDKFDEFDGKELGEADGKISIDGAEKFTGTLIDIIFSEETIRSVHDLMKKKKNKN